MKNKIAVACLATGEYEIGARVLFHTLRKYGGLTDDVDALVIGPESSDYAQAVPLDRDFAWVPVSQENFPMVADKFYALTLDYERIITIDADMMCVGDCSLLWSDKISSRPYYACRDTAATSYYAGQINGIRLDPNLIFNAGLSVTNHIDTERLLREIASGELLAYDGSDQGYLNAYFQLHNIETGFLPPEYNCVFDTNMPQVPEHAMRIVHFAGCECNPWNAPPVVEVDIQGIRDKYIQRWKRELQDCT